MGNFTESERELIGYFSDSSGGYWPSGGGYEPRTQSTLDPEASMANVLDSAERGAARRMYREVTATLAALEDRERLTLSIAYTPRPLGSGAMMACLMSCDDPTVDTVLSPYQRPVANLAAHTDAARRAYRRWLERNLGAKDPVITTQDVIGWLDDEAHHARARDVFGPIREEASEIMAAALAAYEVERRVRVKGTRTRRAA